MYAMYKNGTNDNCLHFMTLTFTIMQARRNIPKIPSGALKHYWSAVLDDLKNESIFTYNLWKSTDRPQSDAVFDMKKNAKYRYKL